MADTTVLQVMIMAPDQFKEYVPKEKEIADSKKTSEVLICITVENHEDVDNIVNAAVKSGGMADPTILPQYVLPFVTCSMSIFRVNT
jgi:predicted lactoylglutathione lyase